jgi:hypothetical protein
MAPFGHAGERHAAGIGDRSEEHRRLRPIKRLMLDVERKPIEPHPRQYASGK